jgi:raffinose/stachyose/melibiose transport system permease protein
MQYTAGIRDKKNNKTSVFIGKIIQILIISCILIIIIAPFYISFLYSFKSHTEISTNRLALPQKPTFENYIKVMTKNEQFLIGYKNSILTTIPTVFILMIVTSMASYVLARYNGRFYKIIYTLFISGILIPFQCIMMPLYLNIYHLGLTSTNIGFILVRTGMQISISILVVTGFVKTVPRELEESANIDGCNRFSTFWRIVFPLMKPVNATQLVLNTLFVWNDYNVALVILRNAKSRTLPLAQIIYFNENTTELNLAFAFFTMVMLPILILYLLMQKHIVSGIMAGAVKG